VRPVAFDHVVLLCRDVEVSLAWWRDLVGAAVVREDEWRAGTAPFVSVRLSADSIIDLIPGEPEGCNVDHLCVVVEPIDLDEVAASGRFEVVDGPARRFGARGEGTSLYVRDPDGNLVELRHYGRA
jgi:catechol 2,3-dioxygenase-like lactoylglutathione lyase family enzyme